MIIAVHLMLIFLAYALSAVFIYIVERKQPAAKNLAQWKLGYRVDDTDQSNFHRGPCAVHHILISDDNDLAYFEGGLNRLLYSKWSEVWEQLKVDYDTDNLATRFREVILKDNIHIQLQVRVTFSKEYARELLGEHDEASSSSSDTRQMMPVLSIQLSALSVGMQAVFVVFIGTFLCGVASILATLVATVI